MKKAIAVLIVLTIIINLIGFGVLTPKSSAAAEAIVTYVICPALMSLLSSWLGHEIESAVNRYQYNEGMGYYSAAYIANEQAIKNGEVFRVKCFDYGDTKLYSFEPAEDLTGEDLEFATFFCDYMNNETHSAQVINSMINSNVGSPLFQFLNQNEYKNFKTDAINAYFTYLECKRHELDTSDEATAMDALAAELGESWSPGYDFDFYGPITPAQMSGLETMVGSSITKDGFILYPPHIAHIDNNGWFTTEADAQYFAGGSLATITNNNAANPTNMRWSVTFDHSANVTQKGFYVLYDGEVYYYLKPWGNSTNISFQTSVEYLLPAYYVCAEGVHLSDVYNSPNNRISGLPVGVIYNVTGEYTLPGVSSDDLTISDAGGELDMSYTDDEDTVRLWLEATDPEGLRDHTLTIDSNGNITAVDGIDLSNIEAMLKQIADSQYDFSSFESYLERIVSLLTAEGVEVGKIDDVIDTLRAWEATQSASLDAINTNIDSIARALEAAEEADLDVPDYDADTYLVTHSGLSEATQIVNGLPIVNQISSLLGNLLDASQYDNSAPNFKFYADMDGNGVSEQYNILDLSFLETNLNNNNLDDTDRFSDPMTIRQFLQYLIIFICYVAFGIRVIKKLPSLFGGSESSEQFTSDSK